MLRTISMNKNCTWNINYIGKNYKHFCEVFQHKKTEPFPCLSSKQTLHIHSSSLHYVRVSLLQYVHMDNKKNTWCFKSDWMQINAGTHTRGPSVVRSVMCKHITNIIPSISHHPWSFRLHLFLVAHGNTSHISQNTTFDWTFISYPHWTISVIFTFVFMYGIDCIRTK